MPDILPLSEKRCSRCVTVKPTSQFNKQHHSRDGFTCWCKSCLWQHRSRDRNPPPEGQKRCSSCQTFQPLDQFFNDRNTKDGYGYECKPCHKERQSRLVSMLEPTAERLVSKRGLPRKSRAKEFIPQGHKRCLKCDEMKPVSDFNHRKTSKDGYDSYCKICNHIRPQLPIVMPEEKLCSKCDKIKPAIEFYVTLASSKTGLSSYCRDCSTIAAKRPYSSLTGRRRTMSYYGITLEEYEQMLQEQNGNCASCGYPETTVMRGKVAPLAVDHCHVTDAVRGLLCRKCNQALGLLCDDPDRIEALLKYTRERVLY